MTLSFIPVSFHPLSFFLLYFFCCCYFASLYIIFYSSTSLIYLTFIYFHFFPFFCHSIFFSISSTLLLPSSLLSTSFYSPLSLLFPQTQFLHLPLPPRFSTPPPFLLCFHLPFFFLPPSPSSIHFFTSFPFSLPPPSVFTSTRKTNTRATPSCLHSITHSTSTLLTCACVCVCLPWVGRECMMYVSASVCV